MTNFLKLFAVYALIILLQGFSGPINPSNNAVYHNNLGVVCLKEGNYNAAIGEFKLAISLNPNSAASASFYNNLGLAYLRIRKYSWAKECFKDALVINPYFLEYRNNLAKANKSIIQHKKTIKVKPEKHNKKHKISKKKL